MKNFTLERETFLFVLCGNKLQNLQPEIYLARLLKNLEQGTLQRKEMFANIQAKVRHFIRILGFMWSLICRPKNVENFTLENVRPGMSEAATNLKYLRLLGQNSMLSYCCFKICLHPGKIKPNNQYKTTNYYLKQV